VLRHYLIWTWRTLAADRLTTLLNLLALSLGLVSFALAAAVALYLRSDDMALPNADRIYAVSEQIVSSDGTSLDGPFPLTGSPAARSVEADYPEIEAVTLLIGADFMQMVVAGKYRQLAPMFFDETFARIFKLPLRYGDPAQAFSQPHAVILTPEAAENLFGAVNPVGQPLRIGTADATVTGVLEKLPSPSIFRSTPGNHIDLLASRDVRDQVAPLQAEPDAWDNLSARTMVMLAQGQSAKGLTAKLADFGQRHVQRPKRTYKFGLVPLADVQQVMLDSFIGADKTGLSVPVLLLCLGGLVLFVASLNYANLAAAKAAGRLAESGMKKVLGASRSELLTQYLIESLALSVAALVLVLAALAFVADSFVQATGIDLSRLLFHRPLFWLLLLAGVFGATFAGGLYPAWLLSGPKAMAATLGGKARLARSPLASVLVGLQFLTASFLLVMVLIVSLQNSALNRLALPADGSALLSIDTSLDGTGIGPADVRRALRGIPGVQAVAGSNALPWSVGPEARRYFKDAGVTGSASQGTDFEVTEDYFAAVGSHLLAGRLFALDRGGDLRPDEDVPTVSFNVVVDRGFAQAFGWTAEQAVGQNIWHNTLTGGSAPVQIIGVIENQPQVLLANGAAGTVFALAPAHAVLPLVRLAPGAGPETLAAIDRALVGLAPQIDWHHHFSDELFKDASAILTMLVTALGGLALFAVIIALLGLAGMAVHTINSRTEEVGIRKILGADHLVILRLLLWDLSWPVLIAAIAAWPLGYVAGQFYLSLFTDRTPLGPWPFVASLVVTLGVAWATVGWRVARASAKSPADVLRYE
jgi:putative ABC transport system permease protein